MKTTRRKPRQAEYDFTVALAGTAELTPALEDALFAAGCNDATISVRSWRVFMTFSRPAGSLKQAVLSAIQDVQQAGVGARVLRVDARDLVTQAEIARRIGRSRQFVHQYIGGARGPGGFPAPVCDVAEAAALWSWRDVAHSLWQHDLVQEAVLREAQELAVINSVLELQHQQQSHPELTREVCRAVGAVPIPVK